jgi:NADPH:quinone reductase-like Zn-dependent oxidoreductase
MKAAIIPAAGKPPVYGDFDKPVARQDEVLVSVRASALSNLAKMRASGSHYSSSSIYPAVPGVDGVGVTPDGRRVYFAMPDPPNGALAEFCAVKRNRCIAIPDSLDDVTAAAIANPGMSVWGALVERAHMAAGETVLVNGATGTAGRIAVQLAKYLGAGRVIATGRNAEELEEVKALGADVTIPFSFGVLHPSGAAEFQHALEQAFATGIDVVVDYLWGESAKAILAAIAKTAVEAKPIRFVQVGQSSREETIELPASVLRSSAITLMGSGLGSVSTPVLLQGIERVFEAVQPAGLQIATQAVPLSDVEKVWEKASGKPRLVFTMG